MQIEIKITFDPQTHAIGVSGAIDDKVLAYGMLACAADAIREHVSKKAAGGSPIALASRLPPVLSANGGLHGK